MRILDFSDPGLYIPEFIPVINSNHTGILLFGSRGSAKSYAKELKCIIDSYEKPTRCICIRKTYASLEDSVYKTMQDIVQDLELTSDFTFLKSPLRIVHKNGNEFIFKGMDKPGKAKSVKDPNCANFEEIDELDEQDFKQTLLSLRGKKPIRWIAAMNPPHPEHWTIKKFIPNYEDFEKEDGSHTFIDSVYPDTLVMHSTYLMNPFSLDNPVLMTEMDWLKENDPEEYRVSGLGLVGNTLTGNEFFDYFSRKIHVTNPEINYDLPIHLTFDFNRLPYGTCIVNQIEMEGETIILNIVDEICPKPPNNSIEEIAEEFELKHSEAREVFIYGDPSGQSKNQAKTRAEAKSYREQIQKSFAKYLHNHSNRFISKAPPLAGRRMAWKKLFSGDFNFIIRINDRCKNTIKDFESLLIGDDGGWQKEMITDKQTKQRYQKNGHCADAETYLVCKLKKDLFYT